MNTLLIIFFCNCIFFPVSMIFLVKGIRQIIAVKMGRRYDGKITWDHTVAGRVYVTWKDENENIRKKSFLYIGKHFSSDDIAVYGFKNMASCGIKTMIWYFIFSAVLLAVGIYFTVKSLNVHFT